MKSQRTELHPHPEQSNQTRNRRCRHIHAAGHQCGSPCLRTEHFCYFHHTTRRPISDPKARRVRATTYELPVPEDRDSIRAAIAQVMHDIANNHIEPRRAGLILYSLQLALCALPKEPAMPRIVNSISAAVRPANRRNTRHNSTSMNDIPVEPIVEEAILDQEYGLIAPETFLEPEHTEEEEEDPGDEVLEGGRLLRNTLGYKLLKDVELYEARTQGWYRGRADALDEAAKAAATAAGQGAKPAELSETLAKAAAKAVVEQADFTAKVAAGRAKYSFYTGKDQDEDAEDTDHENAPPPELEPWVSPILPNLNASAATQPVVRPACHSRRESAFPAQGVGCPIHAPGAPSIAASSRWVGKRCSSKRTEPRYRTAPLIASSN